MRVSNKTDARTNLLVQIDVTYLRNGKCELLIKGLIINVNVITFYNIKAKEQDQCG